MGLFARKKEMKGPQRIYIVEDSKTYALQLQHRIQEKFPDVQILTFPVTETVDAKLQAGLHPSVIILDYQLNTRYEDAESGLESINRLRELSPNTAIFLHTANEKEFATPEVPVFPKTEAGITSLLNALEKHL